MKFYNTLFPILIILINGWNFVKCGDDEVKDGTPRHNLSDKESGRRQGLEDLTRERSGETRPVTTGSKQLVLDLDERTDTKYTEYRKDNNLRLETYTAMEGYAFTRLKRGETEVWVAGNDNKYPYKVEVTTRNRGTRELRLFCDKKRYDLKDFERLDQESLQPVDQKPEDTTPVTPKPEEEQEPVVPEVAT